MIKQASFPSNSMLLINEYDYYDSYESTYSDKNNRHTIEHIGKTFFSTSPKWVDYLFNLRNRLVKVIGLKTPDGAKKGALYQSQCKPGQRFGFFKVLDKRDDEVILGEEDKHLDFKVSILKESYTKEKKKLTITTVVKYNNKLGKIYFFIVKPFHKAIVRSILKGIIKNLENHESNKR